MWRPHSGECEEECGLLSCGSVRSRGTHRLHLQDGRVNQARNQQQQTLRLTFLPWRQKWYDPLKCRFPELMVLQPRSLHSLLHPPLPWNCLGLEWGRAHCQELSFNICYDPNWSAILWSYNCYRLLRTWKDLRTWNAYTLGKTRSQKLKTWIHCRC